MKEEKKRTDSRGQVTYESKKFFPDPFNEVGYRVPTHKAGSRTFRDIALPKEMNWSDKGRLNELCTYWLVGDSNILGCGTRTGPRAFNVIEIGEIIGLNGWRGRQWVNKLIKLRVLYKGKDIDGNAFYMVNPAYNLIPGHRITDTQYILFRSELHEILPANVITEFNRRTNQEPVLRCNAVEEAKDIVEGEG